MIIAMIGIIASKAPVPGNPAFLLGPLPPGSICVGPMGMDVSTVSGIAHISSPQNKALYMALPCDILANVPV